MKVLVTGAAGTIGRRLLPELSPHFEVVAADLHPEPGMRELDVTRLESVMELCRGVDAIVHLAIASGHAGPSEDEEFNRLRFEVNVWGTRNIFEAAVRSGVRRVLYTSSIMVVWGYPPGEDVPAGAPARPLGTYAISKYLGEVMGRTYHEQHGLDVLALRIAMPVDPDDPALRLAPIRPQWIAFPELCRAYRLALQNFPSGCHMAHLVGESSRRRWDLSEAERLFGYRPAYSLEDHGCTLDPDW